MLYQYSYLMKREVPKTAAELEKERQEAQKETEIKDSQKKKHSLFSFFGGISEAGLGNIFSKNQTDLDSVKACLFCTLDLPTMNYCLNTFFYHRQKQLLGDIHKLCL